MATGINEILRSIVPPQVVVDVDAGTLLGGRRQCEVQRGLCHVFRPGAAGAHPGAGDVHILAADTAGSGGLACTAWQAADEGRCGCQCEVHNMTSDRLLTPA